MSRQRAGLITGEVSLHHYDQITLAWERILGLPQVFLVMKINSILTMRIIFSLQTLAYH